MSDYKIIGMLTDRRAEYVLAKILVEVSPEIAAGYFKPIDDAQADLKRLRRLQELKHLFYRTFCDNLDPS